MSATDGLPCGHTKLFIDGSFGPERVGPCLWCENHRLRNELAAAMLERDELKRLSAATPDLLEVVKRCTEAFREFQLTFTKLNQTKLAMACALVEQACKLVIAKAEGRS